MSGGRIRPLIARGPQIMSQATGVGEPSPSAFEKKITALISWLGELFRPCEYASRNSAASDRLSDLLRSYDAQGERTVAAAQGAIATFVLMLHMIARIGQEVAPISIYVVAALLVLIASSVLRARLSRRETLPERGLNALNVFDVVVFLLLIWSYQFAYNHAAGGVLKTPSLAMLFVLVGLRALRFHPVPLIVTGGTAVVGWLVLILAVIAASGSPALTTDYGAYLATYKIMVGAEVEKLAALLSLTACLAIATCWARLTLVRLDNTFEHMPHAVAMFDAQNRLVMCNALYGSIYGLTREDVRPGRSIEELVALRQRKGVYGPRNATREFVADWLDDFERASTRIQELADGRTLSVRRKRKADGGMITTTVDISDRKLLEARIEHMAYHDALTGLANRTQLLERLEKLLEGRHSSDLVAVHCLDLDRFKEVNDTLGHPIGDALLRAVADRLRNAVGATDIVARTGGDEFIIVQASATAPRSAEALAEQLVAIVNAPYTLSGHQVIIGASLGVSVSSGSHRNGEELIRQADIALYRAKEDGRGTFRLFEERMNARLLARRRLERELRQAIDNREFELYYQPIVDASRYEIIGVEALIRWHHPKLGMVSPGEFIPLAEEIGLAAPIGEWVIDQACHDASGWADEIKVAVNVSAAQFRQAGLIDTINNALKTSGLKPSRLEVEITETALLEDCEITLQLIDGLRALGVKVAMDDFGTGYASLSNLQKFPFNRIKIDRSFISEVAHDESARQIVRSVIALSRGLGMATTGEGVETIEQLNILKVEGCSDIQGYLVSKPQPLNQIEAMFASLSGSRLASKDTAVAHE